MPMCHTCQPSRGLSPEAREGRDLFFWILALLCLLRLIFLVPVLVPADLNLTYPFMAGDSYDWLANGLRLAGEDVRYSGRPPLLPILIALLDRMTLLSWLPALLQGLFLGTVLAFYSLAARLTSRGAAFAAALALLVNDSLAGLSLELMADVPASCLLLLAVRSFQLAGEGAASGVSRRRYWASGLFAGLSALTQAAGVLFVPAAAAAALVHRRRDWRSFSLWAALSAPLVLPVLWLAVQPAALAGSGGIAREQWRLLSLHVGSAAFYLYGLASLLGLPGAVLLVCGVFLAARRAPRDPSCFLILALSATLALFFVFLYDYNAKRFLCYGVWLGGLFVAEALAWLPSRAAFAGAAALLVACSALPLGVSGNDPSTVAVWPAPPVYLRAGTRATATGSAVLDLRSARCIRGSPAVWMEEGSFHRACEEHGRVAAGELADPARFAADRSALFLYSQAGDGGGRYRTVTRLGNALRKRVKFVPAAYFQAYWRWIGLQPLGTLAGDYAVYRARLPNLDRTWIVAVAAQGPLRPRLDDLAARPSGGKPAASPRLRRSLREAAAVQGFVAGSDGFVALVPFRRRRHLSQLFLPFLLKTTELYVADAGREGDMLELFAGAPVRDERRLGAATVRKTEYLGRRTSLISFRPSGRSEEQQRHPRDRHQGAGDPSQADALPPQQHDEGNDEHGSQGHEACRHAGRDEADGEQRERDAEEGTEEGSQRSEAQRPAVAHGLSHPRPPAEADEQQGVAGDAGEHAHLRGGHGVVAAHPELAQHQPDRLAEGAAEAHGDAGERRARRRIAAPRAPLQYGPGDAGDGEGHAEQGAAPQGFAQQQPADDGGQRRRQRHHELGEARPDGDVGPVEAEVTEGEAHEPGEAEPAPGPRRSVDGQRQAAHPPRRETEEPEGEDEPDQAQAEGADAARGGLEGERRQRPAGGGAEGGELAGVGGHGGEA
jgi:4-amino-4-deoxy-L-arabinose transferase-like glycosyltransferase